jgi:hypothetical protein
VGKPQGTLKRLQYRGVAVVTRERTADLLTMSALQFQLQSFVQAIARFLRQWHRFGVAIDVDGLLARIHDEPAPLALLQMNFQFCPERRVESVIQITGKLLDKVVALHWFSLRRK